MLPAGSLNQAIVGPWSRAIPFSSCGKAVEDGHPDSCLRELVDRSVDIRDREIEDRVGRRDEIVLRVDHDLRAPDELELQKPQLVERTHGQPQRFTVEGLRGGQVVNGKSGKRLAVLEHVVTSSA
ncbi:MAG: hypothetical protein H0X16_05280 [Chloroflexi bacterium]|nr:hypothetical protein [Chloroflexota bacterium]